MKTQMVVSAKQKILTLTGISEQDYENALFNTACEYLERITSNDDRVIKSLQSTKQFWAWWKNIWNLADHAFYALYEGTPVSKQHHLQNAWYRRHSHEKIVATMTDDVYNAGRKNLIQLIEDEKKERSFSKQEQQ